MGEAIEATSVERVRAWETTGVGLASVRLRALNALGAPVGSDDVTVQVDGAPVDVEMDAWGLGRVDVTGLGTHEVALPDGTVVAAHVVGGDWAGTGLRPADFCPDGTLVRRIGEARVVVDGGGLWWCAEGPPEQLLDLGDDPILALTVGDLEGDGGADLLVRSRSRALWLRGGEDGLVWAGGVSAEDARPAGMDVGDVDGDSRPDLVLAWARPGDPVVDVLRGTGVFDFALLERVHLVAEPVDAALLRGAGGSWELAVVEADGRWERHRRDEGAFVLIDGQPPTVLEDGAALRVEGDFHGDGVEDIALITPRQAGAGTVAQLFNLTDSPSTFIRRETPGAWVDVGDADGDGVLELWTVVPDGDVKVMRIGSVQPIEWTTGQVAAGGLFVVEPAVPRARLWVHVVDHWQRVTGTLSEQSVWRVGTSLFDNLLVDVRAAWPLPATDERVWWGGVQVVEGGLEVKRWAWTPGSGAVVESGRVSLSPGAGFIDHAVCGDTLYALAGGELVAVDLDGPPAVSARVARSGSRVTCWEAAVAVLDGGDAVWLDGALAEARREAMGSVWDLALVPGEGGLEAVGCAALGCEIATWPDAPGGPAAVHSDADGLRVATATGAVPLQGGGAFLIEDVDGDGRTDVLSLREDGRLVLDRATDTAVVGAKVWFVARGVARPWFFADGDEDGEAELFATDASGRLFVTAPPPE